MKNFCASAFALTLVFGTSTAFAYPVVTLTEQDSIYNYNPGGFTGTIDSGATGNDATISLASSVYGAIFTIDFTNASGVVTDVLQSGAGSVQAQYPGDSLEFFGNASGNAQIGTTCVATGDLACVVATGAVQDVTGIITGLNYEGIAYGGDLSVQVGDASMAATPEPGSLALLGTGLAGMMMTVRRRFAAAR